MINPSVGSLATYKGKAIKEKKIKKQNRRVKLLKNDLTLLEDDLNCYFYLLSMV